jgi:hypothetical protein
MDPKKVKAIKEWPSPKNIYEVRSFHGLASFYRKFIRNFNSICAPIVETIKKENQPFKWTTTNENGFIFLKETIIELLRFKLLLGFFSNYWITIA